MFDMKLNNVASLSSPLLFYTQDIFFAWLK
jgi:hypothetical protein